MTPFDIFILYCLFAVFNAVFMYTLAVKGGGDVEFFPILLISFLAWPAILAFLFHITYSK